jgi:hypothetical protein
VIAFRHPYSTNSEERKIVPGGLAVLALFTSFAITGLFHIFKLEPPPQVDVTSVLALYGLYYWLFKKFWWKWQWLRTVGIVSTPILEGSWAGTIQRTQPPSYSYVPDDNKVVVKIGQDWNEIVVRLDGAHSHSRSVSAAITVSEDETSLNYEYISEPYAHAVEGMNIHYGTARLTLKDGKLVGDYYTGRGRLTTGTIQLHRKN